MLVAGSVSKAAYRARLGDAQSLRAKQTPAGGAGGKHGRLGGSAHDRRWGWCRRAAEAWSCGTAEQAGRWCGEQEKEREA